MSNYEARAETYEHIRCVQRNMLAFAAALMRRSIEHDQSKLLPPEADMFEAVTDKLKSLTYGSEEYKEALKDLGPALKHHYEHNSHHPEHYAGGISDMSLLDLVEMFCDWCAATKRHEDGSIIKSVTINQQRFKYSDDLKRIMLNSRYGMECKE